jgi:hypothetical protein
MEICAWCQPIRNERQTVEVRVQENVRARHCHRSVYAQKHTAQARFRPPSQSAASSNKSESNLNKAKKKITHPFPASIRTDTWARPAASRRNSASYLGDETKKTKKTKNKNKKKQGAHEQLYVYESQKKKDRIESPPRTSRRPCRGQGCSRCLHRPRAVPLCHRWALPTRTRPVCVYIHV